MEGLDLILLKFMNGHLLILILCTVAIIKKMTKNLLSDNHKDVVYPLASVIFGLLFGLYVVGTSLLITLTTIGLASGGVMVARNFMKSVKQAIKNEQ